MSKNILLLGGISEAKKLAVKLSQQGYAVTYSIAGLVRKPDLPCQVISGGFRQYGGMAQYIRDHAISLILDVTHPYAVNISEQAVFAAEDCHISCWRLTRKSWVAQPEDKWQVFPDWETLCTSLSAFNRVFFSHGQLSGEQLKCLIQNRHLKQHFFLRVANPTPLDLPDWFEVIQAIGPFARQDELSRLRQLQIDVLVSKNSGGDALFGKIDAARQLGIKVFMLQRPKKIAATREFANSADLLAALSA